MKDQSDNGINAQPQENPKAESASSDNREEQRQTDEQRAEDISAKIADLQSTIEALKDQLLRKAAEFENYRKRMDNEFAAVIRSANENLLVALLPIVDDLARSLKAGKERPDFESFYRGVEIIHNKFARLLESQGVKEIESVGKPFDVYYHEAIMEIPQDGVPPHTILEEVEKGYTFHDRVIRHAKVVIAADPSTREIPVHSDKGDEVNGEPAVTATDPHPSSGTASSLNEQHSRKVSK